MVIRQNLRMDLNRCRPTSMLSAVQGEANTRVVVLSLYNNGDVWNVPSGLTVSVAFKRPDGKKGIYSTLPNGIPAVVVFGNTAEVTLAPQTLIYAGKTYVTVNFYDVNGDILATFPFTVLVEENPAVDAEDLNDSADIPSGSIPVGVVLYTEQDLTPEQKTQARKNIGAAAIGEVGGSTFDPTVYGLPVLHLTGDTTGMSKDNSIALDYVYGELSGTATVKWQGSSSLAYPKKNYTIQFDHAFEAVEGWGVQNKYCLKANYIDFSHARNVVSAKLWGEIVKSRTNANARLSALPNGGAVDGFPCIVLLNGDFHGLYTFNIPKDGWMYGMGENDAVTETENLAFDAYITDENSIDITTFGYTPAAGVTAFFVKKRSTLDGGRAYVTWDTNKVNNFGVRGYLFDANGNPYKIMQINTPILSGEYGTDVWVDIPDSNIGHMWTENVFSVAIPDGCTVMWEFLVSGAETPDGTLTNVWSAEAEANGTWLYTWVKTGIESSLVSTSAPKEAILCANGLTESTKFQTAATLSGDFEIEYASDTVNDGDALSSLNRLINACINSDGTDLDSNIAKYLDWDSAIDYYIYACLIGGADIAGKNYLLSTYDGTKWFFGAYDMDSTFGLWWDGTKFLPDNHYPTVEWYANYHRAMWLIWNYKRDALKARYAELRAGALSENNVALAFSNFINKIPSTVYMEDAKKWPGIPSTAANNLAQILNWYRMRVAVLDKEVESMT